MAAELLTPQKQKPQLGEARAERTLISSFLAIVAFIVLIVIIVWGLVHAASLSSTWFASLFNRSPAGIQLTVPQSANSGTPFTISWKYSTSEKGMYAFLYQCKSGLQFQTPSSTGAMNSIPCGAAYSISGTTNSLSVTPFLLGNASTSVPVSILFIPSTTGTRVQGNASITINPGVAPLKQETAKPAAAPARVNTYKGPADLSVRILSAYSDPMGNATVTFDIANVGGSSSGVYYFTATLPTIQGYVYSSPAQASLHVGDHIANTLRFSQAVPGIVLIVVDPSHSVSESNENNNIASQTLSMPYQPQPYPMQPMPYQQAPYVY